MKATTFFSGNYTSKSTGETKPCLFVQFDNGVQHYLHHGFDSIEDAIAAIKADKAGLLSKVQLLQGNYGIYATFAQSELVEL